MYPLQLLPCDNKIEQSQLMAMDLDLVYLSTNIREHHSHLESNVIHRKRKKIQEYKMYHFKGKRYDEQAKESQIKSTKKQFYKRKRLFRVWFSYN